MLPQNNCFNNLTFFTSFRHINVDFVLEDCGINLLQTRMLYLSEPCNYPRARIE